nr:unnamed protein product [Callosobruchus chinensis]
MTFKFDAVTMSIPTYKNVKSCMTVFCLNVCFFFIIFFMVLRFSLQNLDIINAVDVKKSRCLLC